MIDTTTSTDFSWARAMIWTAATALIWVACALVVRLVAGWQDWPWVTANVPGLPVALAFGVGIEYLRRDRARRDANKRD